MKKTILFIGYVLFSLARTIWFFVSSGFFVCFQFEFSFQLRPYPTATRPVEGVRSISGVNRCSPQIEGRSRRV